METLVFIGETKKAEVSFVRKHSDKCPKLPTCYCPQKKIELDSWVYCFESMHDGQSVRALVPWSEGPWKDLESHDREFVFKAAREAMEDTIRRNAPKKPKNMLAWPPK